MNYEKFLNDLDFGNKNENYVAEYLKGHLNVRNYKENRSPDKQKLKEFDITIETNDNEYFTIEVKADRHFATAGYDSGNIFIETENSRTGQPSGLYVTTAKYFITYFICFGEIWLIETDKLKTLIEGFKESGEIAYREDCGDGNASGYTLPKGFVREYFDVFTPEHGVERVPMGIIKQQEEERIAEYARLREERAAKARASAQERKRAFESSDVLKNLFKT